LDGNPPQGVGHPVIFSPRVGAGLVSAQTATLLSAETSPAATRIEVMTPLREQGDGTPMKVVHLQRYTYNCFCRFSRSMMTSRAFCNALPRWETRFFSPSVISLKRLPSGG